MKRVYDLKIVRSRDAQFNTKEVLVNNDARLKLSWKLTGQWHDRVQTESQIATVDSCFDLIGSLQHGVSQLAAYFTACYTVLKRLKVETAVHGCNLAFSLDSIVSFPR